MGKIRTDRIKGFKAVLILPAIFVLIAFLLNSFYCLPFKDTFLWYFGVFICFYVPGNLLLRFLDFDDNEHTIQVFHSIALGVALLPLVYITFRRLNHPELLYGLVFVTFLVWSIIQVREFKDKKLLIQVSHLELLSFSVLLVFVFGLLHLTYFTDVVFLEKGIQFRNIFLTETDFYLGIVNVLKTTFPPFYPYASGTDFSHYHLFMHLEIEMLNRFLSLDTIKLTFFYFPLMYFCLLVYLPYIFIRKGRGSRILGVLTGILIFGSDLSFVPGMFGLYPHDYAWARFMDFPWALFFRPVVWPIFCLNGLLPSLFVFFLCVLYLKKYYENGGILYLIVFAFLGFAAFGFKSSMGLHIAGSSFLAGIVSAVIMDDRKKGKVLSIVSVVMLLAMIIDTKLLRGGLGNVIILLEPFNNFQRSLVNIRFPEVPWAAYPIVFILYMFASFGVRTVGFYFIKDIFRKKSFDPILLFLIIFSLAGFFLSEMIYLGNLSHLDNNGMWFSMQSLTGAWLLLSFFLWKYSIEGKRLFVSGMLVILLAAPTTMQFLSLRFDNSYYTISSYAMEIVKYLEKTPAETVVLHPSANGGPELASNLAGRSSVINSFHSHVKDMIGEDEVFQRSVDVDVFFDKKIEMDRSFILRKYMIDYVYAPASYTSHLERESELVKIFSNAEFVLYRVKSAGSYGR